MITEQQSQWVRVTDRLPENKKPVLGIDETDNYYICSYTKGGEIVVDIEDGAPEDFNVDEINEQFFLKPSWYELVEQVEGEHEQIWLRRNITHWQPLPTKPKK